MLRARLLRRLSAQGGQSVHIVSGVLVAASYLLNVLGVSAGTLDDGYGATMSLTLTKSIYFVATEICERLRYEVGGNARNSRSALSRIESAP